jgi:hypothetical protein
MTQDRTARLTVGVSQFRMNYEMFQVVVDQIRDDDVFRNNSRNPQAPVEYQLMVALAKFGHYGNAVGARSIAKDFRVAGEKDNALRRHLLLLTIMITLRYTRGDCGQMDAACYYCTAFYPGSMDTMA